VKTFSRTIGGRLKGRICVVALAEICVVSITCSRQIEPGTVAAVEAGMTMNGLSRWSVRFLAALALATGACDAPGSDDQYDQSAIPATAEDLAGLDMTASALSTGINLNSTSSGSCEEKSENSGPNKNCNSASNKATSVWNEDFETYPSGSSVGNYAWWHYGTATLTVSREQSGSGKQSYKLSATKNEQKADFNRAGGAFCAPWGTTRQLTAKFKIRYSSIGSWSMIGITDNPRMAAWWWVGPDGGLREGNFSMSNPKPSLMTVKANTWYEVTIAVDLAKDNAKITFGSMTKSVSLSSAFGTIAVPIECLRVSTGFNIDQDVFIDKISITSVR
jgi:hypothetical protein